ncbi:MAG: ABC transporter substrate-binding protein [Bacillati bacterium ANGP1]|uniref:ABC transporter substrate-binding protein n=1 Tax=Candidatus Segetimicrobium genomatis TaxID=2569760 RepID=A0A537JJ10_9BACT|nr:MAG: ABC transporter substrate-binding protein [Terrabacteria group bacterium ANGP1]
MFSRVIQGGSERRLPPPRMAGGRGGAPRARSPSRRSRTVSTPPRDRVATSFASEGGMRVRTFRGLYRVPRPFRVLVRLLPVLLLALYSGLPAGGPGGALAAPGGDQTLIMADDQSDVKTLDPGREFEFAAAFVDLNAYDTLVVPKSVQDFSSFVPHLARAFKISPDGLEYTFTLRDNVKFASGNPVTGEDVKFSLLRLKNLKGNPGWMADPLKDVQVIDARTVKTILNEPFADWLAVLAGPNAAILDGKLAREHGGSDAVTADKDDKAEEWLNQHSAGSGPFVLNGWQKNEVITMERNPNYFLGPAKLAKIEIRDVTSPATQKLQIEKGDIDVAINLTPDLVAGLKGNPNVKIITGQSLDNMYMGLTTNPALDPNLAKKEVRRAIRYAVDYDGILALTNNQAVRGPAVYSVGILGLTPADADRLNPKYNPAKAKELLAQAGLSNGFSFKRAEGAGRPQEGRHQRATGAVGIPGDAHHLPGEEERRGHLVQSAGLPGVVRLAGADDPEHLGPAPVL